MGNEKSQPADLVIEENAIEVSDRWALHSASYAGAGGNPKISVFVAPIHTGGQNLLEKFTKNLMVYRHPCILKYVTTWHKGGKLYLATERVKPLAQALPTQTALQVCIGLQSVLKALIFLHDKAESSHNNVCRATVYVTPDGSWKLGGLEYLCRFSELSTGYLGTAKSGRYDAGISTSEQERLPQPPSSVDCFAFGVLAEEVLSAYSSGDDVPGMQEFKEMCKTQLQNMSCAQRPPLHSLLNLTFFTHEFINIHNFLTELTLKSDVEKQHFFSGLPHKLSMFDEEVVATQLSTLLLSRMVLLDTTAQAHLLPLIFVPRTSPGDDVDNELIGSGGRLFSKKTFRTHLVPKLLPMFCVRDSHVRLILLKHFSSFCNMFSATQLKTHILPELLVGIKDTNDMLVSSTLRALADIVPILGSSVVIGGKSRRKFFADGRPKAAVKMSSGKPEIGSRSNNKPSRQGENDSGGGGNEEMCLPERPSPDGGEDLNSPSYMATDEETENWTDWENNAGDENTEKDVPDVNRIDASSEPKSDYFKSNEINTSQSQSSNNPAHKENNEDSDSSPRSHKNSSISLPDITQLDVKNSKTNLNANTKRTTASNTSKNSHNNSATNFVKEIDYFQDMEPVIVSSNKHIIGDILSHSISATSASLSATAMMTTSNSKFEINDKDLMLNDIEAWGDDVDDNWTVDDCDINAIVPDIGDNNLSIVNDT